MDIVYSDKHLLHRDRVEPSGSQFMPVSEVPDRVDRILAELGKRKLDKGIVAPKNFGMEFIYEIHSLEYTDFLQKAWALWENSGRSNPALPNFWRRRDPRVNRGSEIEALLDYYSGDPGVCLVEGSWSAIHASAECALTAASMASETGGSAIGLCRPPGHHAGYDVMRGSCYLNNAALAAKRLRWGGARRCAVIDLDYHHGNGTQEIFYRSSDILTCSIHADPATDYPYYCGYGDEIGEGDGENFNANFVLSRGVTSVDWFNALEAAVVKMRSFGPDALVVALGVDTYREEKKAGCFFQLDGDDYFRMGAKLARLNLPTVVTLEGGYNLDAIGVNVVNFVEGFNDVHRGA